MVYVLLGEGFEEIEAVAAIDIMRRAGIEVTTVGIGGGAVRGAHGILMFADGLINHANFSDLEMLVIPGGNRGVETIESNIYAMELIKKTAAQSKPLGFICAAPTILAKLGLLKDRRAVCYPTEEEILENAGAKIQRDECVVQDENFITAQAPGSALDFGLKLVTVLRGWEAAEKVRHAICYEGNIRPLT